MTARACFVLALVVALAVALLAARPARADDRVATFALVIGVNRGADPELPALRYADDDAAGYLDLFRLLGTRTHLLARIDSNTARLHPQAAAEASLPVRTELERAAAELAAEIRQAKERGIRTAFYLVYAGHGNVHAGEAYILLEDDRLTGKRLADLVAQVAADQVHVIVDACYSGLLAMSRGAGGRRRSLSGFSRLGPLMADPRIGLLLSTSSARESHEWDGFQAGVFSHEIRSGLLGAADADGDGFVTYREIAAFVERANAAIPNERFRPDVYARAPSSSDRLVDVSQALKRRIEVKTKLGAHYVLETQDGVRLADFHPGPDHTMRIARPGGGPQWLRELPAPPPLASAVAADDTEREYAIPTGQDVVVLTDLDAAAPRVAMRGAAHASFGLLFALPFDAASVRGYRFRPLDAYDEAIEPRARSSWRRPAAIVAFGLGAAATAAGITLTLSAYTLHADPGPGESQASIAERNDQIAGRRVASYVAFAAAASATAAGLAFLLWPEREPLGGLSATLSPQSFGLAYGGSFGRGHGGRAEGRSVARASRDAPQVIAPERR